MVNDFHLTGKTILVTGGSSGIGRQTAIHISLGGGKVIVTGRNIEKLNETLSLLNGDGHKIIVADLTKDDDIANLVKEIGKVDGIVHGAGIAELFPTKYINRKKIEEIYSINYHAPILLMSALFQAKKINPNAAIVFISSFSSKSPFPGGALYTGTKAALENYSGSLAVEHAKTGLRSNCVAPALVKTKIFEDTFNYNPAVDSIDESALAYEKVYLHGLGQPSDVANAIFFLLSPAARWITGQTITLDGGYMLGMVAKVLKL